MRICALGLMVFLTQIGSATGQGSAGLPVSVRTALDKLHPGWRVSEVGADVRAEVGTRLGATPNVVTGDFNGDGRADVAVLIEYRNVDEPQKAFTHYIEVFAFLAKANGYEVIRPGERTSGPDATLYLTLQRRGQEGFDFKANRKFTYPRDSVGVWIFGKAAGGTYIYENGKFRYVLEAD